MTTRPRLAPLSLIAALLGCHEFAAVSADGRCGNGVLEPAVGELCDTVARPEGAACGAPGTEGACQYVCGPLAEARCPAGWACGDDGLCRAPSGRFEPPEVLGLTGGTLSTGDVDGDGRTDLVQVDGLGLTVAYGDAEGRFADRRTLGVEVLDGQVHLGQLDAQPGIDLAVPVSDGVQVVLGGAERVLLPVAEPQVVLPPGAPVHLAPLRPTAAMPGARAAESPARTLALQAQGAVLMWAVVADGRAAAEGPDWQPLPGAPAVPGVAPGPGMAAATEAGRLRSLAFRIAGAAGPDGNPEVVDLVAVTIAGATAVPLLRLACAASDDADCALTVHTQVALPLGLALAPSAPFAADLDGDGQLDLLLVAQGRMGLVAAVARGRTGGFEAAVPAPELGEALRCMVCPAGQVPLLAVGDLHQDGRPHLVSRERVFALEAGPPARLVATAQAPSPWQEVRLADLNADGRPDLVGLRPEVVDLWLANGEGGLNALSVAAPSEARDLTPGDFDGDLALDLALLGGAGEVSVFFSGAQGVPADPVLMARLPRAAQLARLPAHGPSGTLDALRVVGGGRPGEPAPQPIVALRGDTARRMRSGVELDRPPRVAAAGRLLPGSAGDILLGYEEARRWSFVVLPGTTEPGAVVRTPRALEVHPSCTFDGLRALQLGALTLQPEPAETGDVGAGQTGDATAESAPRDTVLALRVLHPGERRPPEGVPSTWPVWHLHLEGDTLRCTALGSLGEGAASPSAPQAADLDGDGSLDAWVGLDPFAAPLGPGEDTLDTGRPGLAVWWGGADGLAAAPSVFLDAPDAERATGLLAAAAVHGGRGQALVSWAEDGLTLLGLAERALRRSVGRPLAAGAVADATSRLVSLDADGDGLADLVHRTGAAVLLARQRACGAVEVAAGTCPPGAP